MKAPISNINIGTLLAALGQIKIWHWQTGGTNHIVLGELYDELDSIIDSFVETSLGRQGDRELPEPISIELDSFESIEESIEGLKKLALFLESDLLVDADAGSTELAAIRDDMLQSVNSAIFKLLPQN